MSEWSGIMDTIKTIKDDMMDYHARCADILNGTNISDAGREAILNIIKKMGYQWAQAESLREAWQEAKPSHRDFNSIYEDTFSRLCPEEWKDAY